MRRIIHTYACNGCGKTRSYYGKSYILPTCCKKDMKLVGEKRDQWLSWLFT